VGAIGLVRFFLSPGANLPAGFREELLGAERLANMPGAVLVRRSLIERIGVFNPEHSIATDIDWFARIKDTGAELGVVDELVIEKRAHEGNLSHSDAELYERGLLLALRQSIRRQESRG
jgi:hypothetical protein